MVVLVVFPTVLMVLEFEALAVPHTTNLGPLPHPQVDVMALAGHEVLRLRADGLVGSLAHQDARGCGERESRGQAEERVRTA